MHARTTRAGIKFCRTNSFRLDYNRGYFRVGIIKTPRHAKDILRDKKTKIERDPVPGHDNSQREREKENKEKCNALGENP